MAQTKKSTAKEKAKENPKITKYELARLIGARALQLSQGAPMKVKLTKKELLAINYDVMEIAKIEYAKGVLPLRVESD